MFPQLNFLNDQFQNFRKKQILFFSQPWNFACLLLIAMIALVVLRVSWVSDDSFITMRVVDNIVNGYGPRWNISERVQVYTHPLWLAVVLPFYWLTREPAFTLIFLSIFVTLVCLILFCFKVMKGGFAAFFGLSLLLSSKAFLEYSTSGLENPLTNLLICALLLIVYSKSGEVNKRNSKDGIWFGLIASLMLLNRLDLATLIAPILIYLTLNRPDRWKCLGWAVIGGLPLLLWLLFSLIYYGQPFPNTAYAKLNTGIPSHTLWLQGLVYINQSVEHDFPTIFVIFSALVSAIIFPNAKRLALVIGVLLNLVYVVKVGGDFMQGRFLVTPFFMSTFIVTSALKESKHSVSYALLGFLFLSVISNPRHPLTINHEKEIMSEDRITGFSVVDERMWYYRGVGLGRMTRDGELPYHGSVFDGQRAKNSGEKVVTRGDIGFFGFYAGPNVYIIDPYALSSVYLARLPVTDPERQLLRVGHFERELPPGYIKSIKTGENKIEIEVLADLFDAIKVITTGSLLSKERMKAIYWLNTGKLNGAKELLLDESPRMSIDIKELPDSSIENINQWKESSIPFSFEGIEIHFDQIRYTKQLEITLSSKDRYHVYVTDSMSSKYQLKHMLIPVENAIPFISYRFDLPLKAQQNGIEKIEIIPFWGDEDFRIGTINIDASP